MYIHLHNDGWIYTSCIFPDFRLPLLFLLKSQVLLWNVRVSEHGYHFLQHKNKWWKQCSTVSLEMTVVTTDKLGISLPLAKEEMVPDLLLNSVKAATPTSVSWQNTWGRRIAAHYHFICYQERILLPQSKVSGNREAVAPADSDQWLVLLTGYPEAVPSPILPCCLTLQSQMPSHIPLQLWVAIWPSSGPWATTEFFSFFCP